MGLAAECLLPKSGSFCRRNREKRTISLNKKIAKSIFQNGSIPYEISACIHEYLDFTSALRFSMAGRLIQERFLKYYSSSSFLL